MNVTATPIANIRQDLNARLMHALPSWKVRLKPDTTRKTFTVRLKPDTTRKTFTTR